MRKKYTSLYPYQPPFKNVILMHKTAVKLYGEAKDFNEHQNIQD